MSLDWPAYRSNFYRALVRTPEIVWYYRIFSVNRAGSAFGQIRATISEMLQTLEDVRFAVERPAPPPARKDRLRNPVAAARSLRREIQASGKLSLLTSSRRDLIQKYERQRQQLLKLGSDLSIDMLDVFSQDLPDLAQIQDELLEEENLVSRADLLLRQDSRTIERSEEMLQVLGRLSQLTSRRDFYGKLPEGARLIETDSEGVYQISFEGGIVAPSALGIIPEADGMLWGNEIYQVSSVTMDSLMLTPSLPEVHPSQQITSIMSLLQGEMAPRRASPLLRRIWQTNLLLAGSDPVGRLSELKSTLQDLFAAFTSEEVEGAPLSQQPLGFVVERLREISVIVWGRVSPAVRREARFYLATAKSQGWDEVYTLMKKGRVREAFDRDSDALRGRDELDIQLEWLEEQQGAYE